MAITGGNHDNGGGYAAAELHNAPRRVREPHLQPQRPPTGAQRGQAQRLPDLHAARTTRPNYKITLSEVSTVSGDCHNTSASHMPGDPRTITYQLAT